MSGDPRRAIIEAVASGELSPEEAAERLEVEAQTGGATEPVGPFEPSSELRAEGRQPSIRLSVSSGGVIEIEGDPGVADVEVDGPHRGSVERHGDDARLSVQTGSDTLLRVNPFADLIVELHGEDAVLRGLRGTLQADCHVGDLTIEAELRRGDSRIDAHAGDVMVRLSGASDLRVVVRTPAEVNVDPALAKTGRGEWTLGSGAATLTIDGNVGDIGITTA